MANEEGMRTAEALEQYVERVLECYVALPETPARANRRDRQHAEALMGRAVPAETVETALLLASLRRLARPAKAPPLGAIRSLGYFLPVIEELLAQQIGAHYREYLRGKLQRVGRSGGERR